MKISSSLVAEEDSSLTYTKVFLDSIFEAAIQRKNENKTLCQKNDESKSEEELNKAMSNDFLDLIFTSAIETHKQQAILNKNTTHSTHMNERVGHKAANQQAFSVKKHSFDGFYNDIGDEDYDHASSKELVKLNTEKEFDESYQFKGRSNEFRIEHKKTINEIVDMDMCIKEDSQEHVDTLSQCDELNMHQIKESQQHNKTPFENNVMDNEEAFDNPAQSNEIDEKMPGLINLIKVDKDSTDFHIDNSRQIGSIKKEEFRTLKNNSSFGSSQSNLRGDQAHSFQPSKAEISYKAVHDHEDLIKSNNWESKKNVISLLSTKKIEEVLVENDKSLSQIERNNEDEHNVIDLETDPYGNSQKTEKKDDGVDFEVLNDVDFDKFNSKENMIDCHPQTNEANLIVIKSEPSFIKAEELEVEHNNDIAMIEMENENYGFDPKDDEVPQSQVLIKPKEITSEEEIKELLHSEMLKLKVKLEEEMKEKERGLREKIRTELKDELIEELKKINLPEKEKLKCDSYVLKKSAKMKEMKSNN